MKETHVIIKVYHTGIDEALILKKAQEHSEDLIRELNKEHSGDRAAPYAVWKEKNVTVHTIPFKVE
jgi:hypothetical protein